MMHRNSYDLAYMPPVNDLDMLVDFNGKGTITRLSFVVTWARFEASRNARFDKIVQETQPIVGYDVRAWLERCQPRNEAVMEVARWILAEFGDWFPEAP